MVFVDSYSRQCEAHTLSNQHVDAAHLGGRIEYLSREVFTTTNLEVFEEL